MCEILHILTRTKCAHAKSVQCACKFCNYVCKSVDVQDFAHSHACEMCAFFITALLTTAKIQESQFAYLPTYKIAKTALKEIVL